MENMNNKYPRIAIVTGATSGIGEATVRKFNASGYGVIGTGRNQEKLDALEKEFGEAFVGLAADVSEKELPARLFNLGQKKYGRVPDIVVVNAGVGLGGSIKEVDISEFEKMLNTNVTATVALLKESANIFEKTFQNQYPEKTADIVLIGSISGRHISPFSYVYGSSKFALHALAEGMRRELAPAGIRVSLIEPALVLSGFQKGAGYSEELVDNFKERFGPLLIGDDIANTIHFIVSQPPHIHISDIVVRPTRQDYP